MPNPYRMNPQTIYTPNPNPPDTEEIVESIKERVKMQTQANREMAKAAAEDEELAIAQFTLQKAALKRIADDPEYAILEAKIKRNRFNALTACEFTPEEAIKIVAMGN